MLCPGKDVLQVMKMIFVFIDGFGIGDEAPERNPFYKANTPALDFLMQEYGYFKTDTTLGVDGLPQSATGQTAIYTGVNAPKALGRHWSARPTQTLGDIIMRDNLFMQLNKRGYKTTFANVYTKEYLEQMEKKPRGIFKPSVTTLLCLSAGIPFRLIGDYEQGKGVFHDITGKILRERGYDVPLTTPEEAGRNLYRVSRDFDFTLFEFFISDIAGHSMDMDKAVSVLELFDKMLAALLEQMDLESEMLWIVSDHGNIEDITIPTHTFNPVPVIAAGKMPEGCSVRISSLTDIAPAVLTLFP